MADQIPQGIIVIDEWEINGEKFRLVKRSAGPVELQTINPHTNDTDWKPEHMGFTHGVLCARIIYLSNLRKL